MKKTVCLILSIIMIFTAMPLSVSAADECDHQVAEWVYAFYSGPDSVNYDCTDPDYKIMRYGTCTACGTYYSELIPTQKKHYLVPLDRYDIDGNIIEENYKEPTCTENGYAKSKCIICTTIVADVLLAEGHEYGEPTVYKKCFEDGSQLDGIFRRYCTKAGCDGYSEERITTHRHMVYEGIEASCFGPGRTDYKICLDCSTESVSVETEKLNHTDADNNGKCDLCFSNYQSEGVYCSCICHSESAFMKLILPIVKIIWQILGVDNCHGDCNAAHYEKK